MKAHQSCESFIFTVLAVGLVFTFCADLSVADTGNLLRNPGAESGNSSWGFNKAAGYYNDGWNNDGKISRARSGTRFWFGRRDDGYADMYQFPALPAGYKEAIKAGGVKAIIGGYVMSWGQWNDGVQLGMQFYNQSNQTITGWINSNQYGNTDWTNVAEVIRDVNTNTASIGFWVQFIHRQGGWNDGYADDVYLKLRFPFFEMISVQLPLGT